MRAFPPTPRHAARAALAASLLALTFNAPLPARAATLARCDPALSVPPARRNSATAALTALFDEDAEREDALDPLSALYRGDVTHDTALARIFTDALERDRLASARRSLEHLAQIPACDLVPALQLSDTLFAWRKEREVADLRPEVRAFEGVRPFNHFGGIALDFPSLIAPGGAFAYRTPDDYARALIALHAFPTVIDNAIARFRQGIAQGQVEPRVTVEHMIAQTDALLAQTRAASPFLEPIADMPADMPADQRAHYTAAIESSAAHDVLPAYARLRAFLHDTYLPAARSSIGLCDTPGGDGLYRTLITRETTLTLDPADIHALGLREVARIEAEMTEVARQLGHTGSLASFFEAIRSDPRFHPTSAQDLQHRFELVADTVDALLPDYFAKLPETPLVLAPYPGYRARYEAGGSYAEASDEDGSPATFFYNTYDLKHRFISGITTLYLHEGMPGHHLQISLARENAQLPAFQRYSDNDAFVEGWALYAETLGYPMGLYKDPLQHWGNLDDEMLRAMRLVVDTGIHAQHWTRQQAIDYMLAHSGMGRTDAETEVDRYIAMPAQALSYKIGALTIERLRHEAETALGPRFDIKAFHEQVIGSGAMPLGILQERVARWIAARQSLPQPARVQASSPASALFRASSVSSR
ncbi:DUF885 domain-containing protein [Novosphingobium sp. 1949]|uniref:DUF885 domain-containing protein n=1 Tax=Novosphingobium organovorum TaxID=2930092 RepID=A0ABT0B7W4_9SPHN|nr:DUF885 domain-containing protein [Novosphingobium organovorum]MCJ2181162.1 DUF885 domain-containing protein [Novosphingobium organovorum]